MERSVAIKKLGKLLGKSLGYRVDPTAPTPEERAAAKAALPAATAELNKLREQRDQRSAELLAKDEIYQRLRANTTAASDHVTRLRGKTYHYKITVGHSSGMFFHVKAEGDSWEEVIDKVVQKIKAERREV